MVAAEAAVFSAEAAVVAPSDVPGIVGGAGGGRGTDGKYLKKVNV